MRQVCKAGKHASSYSSRPFSYLHFQNRGASRKAFENGRSISRLVRVSGILNNVASFSRRTRRCTAIALAIVIARETSSVT